MHVIAAKAVALQDRADRAFRERQRRTVEGAQEVAGAAARRPATASTCSPAAPTCTSCSSTCATSRARRPAGRGPPARDRHHGQPQRGAVRPAPADGHQRAARRHAGARDARPAARGLHRGRRDPRRRARRPSSRRARGELAERVDGDRRALPAVRAAGRHAARRSAARRPATGACACSAAAMAHPTSSTRSRVPRRLRDRGAAHAARGALRHAHRRRRRAARPRAGRAATRRCSAAWRSSPACSSRAPVPARGLRRRRAMRDLLHGVLLAAR